LAVTSQLAVQTVFQQIVQQAEQWLRADAVALFVREQDFIQVAEVAGLPRQFVDRKLLMGVGVSGRVITTKQSILLENYATDWTDDPDMPLATETFGAVVCVPLVAADESIGALMVIAGKHNRAFNGEDVNLLEMLGAQAAVAITHSQSFDKQQLLAQEIEQARNQLQTVLSSTKNPVIAVNQRFELIVSNDAAEQLFPEIKYASPITDVVPSGVLPGDVIDDHRTPISHTYMEEVVLADRIYQSHVAAIGHGDQIDGWVTVMTDVTGLKELDRIKSEMVRMTSHDLKNPLQAALANTELLIDMLEGYHDNDVHDSIAVIDKQLTRMYRIISGVLDMERFRTGKQAMNICAPDVIISNTVGDFRTIAADRQIAVTIDVAPDILPVMGDAGQLERALSNLVENAIKFTPDGGEVDVKAYSEDGNTFFEIKDTGIGIPVSEQSKVFDSFYRAKQRGAEHISGTGLGLHLVKTVIENHEGQVWLDSNGHGTTFYISIPSATDSMMTGYHT
ncbi:MAG: GAF domain-containing sensor histidine kinase, partial [Chloroflexota bacterium]